MEHGDVARLLKVADADVKSYKETDTALFVTLSGDVERVVTEDGVYAVNDCPQNRSLRPLPEDMKSLAGVVTEDKVWVGERGPEPFVLPEGVEVAVVNEGVESDEDSVPDGTAEDVLSWVDGDPKRAALAIEAEQQREKPRSVLLGNLRKVSQA